MSLSLREKIKQRMVQLDIEPKRSLGQNFLVSDQVVEKIIRAAQPSQFSQVFEIGPGLGALTDHLIERSSSLELIELDRKFAEFWRQEGQKVHEEDALRFPWKDMRSNTTDRLLVSNLPYQISSRLVVELSIHAPIFKRMVLMFQKEVAQRIVAPPQSEHYGLMSVVAQCFWKQTLVSEAGPVDFMPKPNVASRVLCFDYSPQLPDSINPEDFFRFLKLSFANRRKKLLPKLVSYQPKTLLSEVFAAKGWPEGVRIENLSPSELISLYLAIKTE